MSKHLIHLRTLQRPELGPQPPCLWPGCDRPVRACQSDHSLEWAAHGATVPRNGGTMCRAHNLFKQRDGCTARRQPDGEWVIRNAAGDPIT